MSLEFLHGKTFLILIISEVDFCRLNHGLLKKSILLSCMCLIQIKFIKKYAVWNYENVKHTCF